MIRPIESAQNEYVKSVLKLHRRKARREAGLCLLEGFKMLEAALDAGADLHSAFFDPARMPQALLKRLQALRCPLYSMPARLVDKLSDTVSAQGACALWRMPDTSLPAQLPAPAVLLDDLSDPGNIGTIIRTADAAGIGCVMLSAQSADPFSPKALRATMGSIFHVPVFFAPDWALALGALKRQGVYLIGADVRGRDFYTRAAVPPRWGLIVGNESGGLSPQSIGGADALLRLPMAGRAESLNAGVAASVMIYDLFRERITLDGGT